MTSQLLASRERCVDEGLEAAAATNPGYLYIPEHRLIADRRWLMKDGKGKHQVALVTGGGSGHEPFCVGYVGTGMLGAAVAGHVFTSPPPAAVAAAITTVGRDNPAGVLVVVFNYTGDRINCGLAVERCRAAGMKVEMYVSGDDTALTQLEGTAGRRGLCGTMFIFKIVGAMTEAGASLEEAMNTCKRLSEAIGTIGVAASGCTLPGASAPLFTVGEGVMELGLGVHGETGAATIKAGTLQEVVEMLLNHLTRKDSETRLDLQSGDKVAVIINNLGGLSQLELSNLTNEVVSQLKNRGVEVKRVYPGQLMTSLDMRGLHVSVLRLLDPTWLPLLDAPTTAPAWPTPYLNTTTTSQFSMPNLTLTQTKMDTGYMLSDAAHTQALKACLEAVVAQVPQYEQHLNDLDTTCGDGDCGSTLIKGINGVSKELSGLPLMYPSQVLGVLGEVTASYMGGTSGGVYSILFTAAAAHITSPKASHRLTWATALRAGCDAISKYGGARQGDRTMLDALLPAVEVLEGSPDNHDLRTILKAMATAADEGSKKTAYMGARAGRATYVRAENVSGEDAGARSVAYILQAMAHY
ncbi:triokinase/FMN cyclase-like isoform X2 [Homarus americanus]|uniref:triokinase/FMN cyclase-like isoform X2 n=1 Tax=Homarus americanus TaxID=6706 RepID=UPI001C49724C|nr:triokinase/FMN cyclase-like isoform X2 [Homarus americanus]